MSVVMCTRDRLDMLKESIESVLDTYSPMEMIVVDSSAHRDAMVKFLESYRWDFFHFKYIYRGRGESDPPCILPICRNEGLANARGEYVTFHDSKNIQGKGKLTKAVEYLDAHPDVDVVFGNAKHPTGDLQNATSAERCLSRGLFRGQWEDASNYIGINSAVWRTALGIRIDPLSGTNDDFDLALMLSCQRIQYIDVDMYRSPGWHPESVSQRFDARDYTSHIKERHRAHYEAIANAPT